jgi:chemotaxis protein MotB
MALQRGGRRGGGHSATIWPGFVDAMTGLLLVLMFVLTIFTVVQFVLRDEISGQQDRLAALTTEVATLASALGLEQDRATALEGDLAQANEMSAAQAALIATLTAERDENALALAEAETRITGFEAQVAGLLAERTDLQATVTGLEAERAGLMTEQEALTLALATARSEIDAAAEEARLAAARREAMETLITRLQSETAAQGQQISDLEAQKLLDAAAAEALRAELADSDAELTAMTLALEEQRRKAEETLTLLAAAEAARADLDVRLAATILARDRAEADLAEALEGSAGLDARLLAALSLQETTAAELAAAQAALDAAEAGQAALTEELATARADLETRLAAALAVGELAAGDLAAARAALDAALAEAETDRSALQERLTQALLAQSALRAELAARAALDNPDQIADLESQLAAALAARDSAVEDRRNAETEADDLAARLAAALEPGGASDRADALAAEAADLRAELAAALAARDQAETDATVAATEAERQAALLAAAQEALSSEEALSAESQRQVALLNEQVAALRVQVGQLQALLDLAETEDAEAQVQIESLGAQLNTALARAAAEERRRAELEEAERVRLEAETERLTAETQDLARYRSEFFGRLRDVVAGQEGIRIEGDRFVFSSEVLFAPGQAELSPAGQAELAAVGSLLRTIAQEIPPGIDWVIRVDGHTDNVPLSGTGQFADNWELSQARALSVVRYLIATEGLAPERLAANGFGEFQPIDQGDTPEARAQNRRIELKLTER